MAGSCGSGLGLKARVCGLVGHRSRAFLIAAVAFGILANESARAQTEPPTSVSAASVPGSSIFGRNTMIGRFTSQLNYGFFNFTSIRMDRLAENSGRLEAYNYFNIDYFVGNRKRISFRPVFHWASAGNDFRDDYKSNEFRVGDAYINYIDSNFATIGSFADIRTDVRVYAPTSEETRRRGQITRIRPWLQVQNRLSRDVELVFHFEPDYYVQSRTGYLNEDGWARGNKHYGYESGIEMRYRVSRNVGAAVTAGYDEMWHHTVPIEGIDEASRRADWRTEASVNMSLGSAFVVLGVSQKRDAIRPRTGYRPLDESESQFYVLNHWRL